MEQSFMPPARNCLWKNSSSPTRKQKPRRALRARTPRGCSAPIWRKWTRSCAQARPRPVGVTLAAVEECAANHHRGTSPDADLLAAVADLRAALPPGTAFPRNR
jgi:hypothetical protein